MGPVDQTLSFYLGSVEELSSTSCDAHLNLLALLFGRSILDEPYSTIMVSKQGSYLRLFADTGGEDEYDITSTAGFSLVKNDSTGYGRILDPCWIDSSLIGQWKHDCDTLHGSKCKRLPNSVHLAPASPNWLIDVNQKCIVPSKPGMRYVALSYVWGSSGQLRSVLSNVEELQEPGSLDCADRRFTVPRTVQDAMIVVTHLQEQYLWVDALCIVQDDESKKQDQLNNMASIYAEATVTIIAKDGHDSSFGLRGVWGSIRRDLNQDVFKLVNNREAVVHRWTVDKKPTPWGSRGWTFQEELFSPRKLIFEGKTVRWECSSATWHEDHDYNTTDECNDPDEDRVIRASALFEEEGPRIEEYGQLLGVYNKRQFTYSADSLNAFAGIMFTLTRAFRGGFLCGLPVMFFDRALLWQPKETICRRSPNEDGNQDTIPPSWSWAGWKGDIDTTDWKHAADSKTPTSTTVSRAVEWYIGEGEKGKKELLKDASSSFSTSTVGHILSCQTDRCFLYVGEQKSRGLRGASFSLLDKHGTCAGSILLHDYPRIPEMLSDTSTERPKENMCELVSISQGYIENGAKTRSQWIDESNLDQRPIPNPSWTFHNVLWIEWEGGVAYRRGLGRVTEEVWQRQELDRINLFLG